MGSVRPVGVSARSESLRNGNDGSGVEQKFKGLSARLHEKCEA